MLSKLRGSRRWQRWVTSLSAVVVFVTTYALILPVITMGRDAVCGQEEHTHDESCWGSTLMCEQSEGTQMYMDENGELVFTDSYHVHDEACYVKALTCGLKEHTHTEACYAKSASELLAVYAEKEYGAGHGPEFYREWYGSEETEDWTALFAAYCLEQAGVKRSELQFRPDSAQWLEALELAGDSRLHAPETGRLASGDLVFLHDGEEDISLAVVLKTGKKAVTLVMAEDDSLIEKKLSLDDASIAWVLSLEKPEEFVPTKPTESGNVPETTEAEELPEQTLAAVSPTAPDDYAEDEDFKELEAVAQTLKAEAAGDLVALADAGSGLIIEPNGTGSVTFEVFYKPTHNADGSVYTGDWLRVEPGASIPADANFQINAKYSGIDPETLAANGYHLKYKIEDYLTDIIAEDDIIHNGEKRGRVSAEDGYVVLTFQERWVDSMKGGTNDNKMTVEGNFSYEGGLDLKKLETMDPEKLKLGDVNIQVPDITDARAEFAEVEVHKESTSKLIHDEDADKYYLEYTLTVQAGKYGAPHVKLIDTLSGATQYIAGKGYVGVTGTAANADGQNGHPVETRANAGENPRVGQVYLTADTTAQKDAYPAPSANGTHMAWTIGEMQPNEVRTLTYLVEVDKSYVGIPHDANNTIKNEAQLFSKDYPRGIERTQYIPELRANLVKDKVSAPVKGEDGLWHVTYRTTVTADKNNSYTLENLKVYDHANSYYGSAYKQFVKLVPSSLKLYDLTYDANGNPIRDAQGNLVMVPIADEDVAQFAEFLKTPSNPEPSNPRHVNDNQPRDFDIFIGDLKPGESRVVEYEMTLNEDAAAPWANGLIEIYNEAELYSDELRHNTKLSSDSENDRVGSQYWSRKMQGQQTRIEQEVPMNTDVVKELPDGTKITNKIYDATGGTPVDVSNGTHDDSFTVPVGAYTYDVVVNEKGNWDVSGANMADTLSGKDSGQNNILLFTGYVQVNVYDQVPGMGNDAAVKQYLQSQTPKQTIWVKVDGKNSFQFTADQLGIHEDVDPITLDPVYNAYILTYYADVNPDAENYGQAVVGNSFNMTGNVGPGGAISLHGIYSSVRTQVIEPGTEPPDKSAWYYDAKDTCFEEAGYTAFNNGAMYWTITFSGGKVPAGMGVQDSTRVGSAAEGDYWNWKPGSGANNNNGDQLPNSLGRKEVSWIGLYSGYLGTDENGNPLEFRDKYRSMEEVEEAIANGELTPVDPKYYNVTWTQGGNPNAVNHNAFGVDPENKDYWDINMRMAQAYGLASGEQLFALVRTQPSRLPENNGTLRYQNKFNYYANANSGPESEKDKDMFVLVDNSNGLRKLAGQVIRANNGSYTVYDPKVGKYVPFTEYNDTSPYNTGKAGTTATNAILQTSYISVDSTNYVKNGNGYNLADGSYLTWTVSVNAQKDLNGSYRVLDTLPEGLELEYVRPYYVMANNEGLNADEYKFAPNPLYSTLSRDWPGSIPETMFAYPDSTLDSSWTRHQTKSILRGSNARMTWARVGMYYYTKDNQIQWYIPQQVRGHEELVFQVVAKIKDPNFYEDQTFNNQAQLWDGRGNLIDDRGAEITIGAQTANKSALLAGLVEKGSTLGTSKFPYEIEVNKPAEDLVPNSSRVTIPLIDRMSSNLTLVNDTLMIFRSPAYSVGPNGKPLGTDGVTEVETTDVNNIGYNWNNLLYYGGTWSNSTYDVGKPWYTTDSTKVGKAVGNVGNVPEAERIRVSVVPALNENGEPLLYNGKQMTNVEFHNLPDSTPLVIRYSVNATFTGGGDKGSSSFSNKAFWGGYEDNEAGDVESKEVYYDVKSEVYLKTHGALLITKFDSNDESNRLAGAEFALYRAEYHDHSDGFLLWTNDVAADAAIRSKRLLAVYLGPAGHYEDAGTHIELRVRRDANGAITEVQVPKNKNTNKVSTSTTDSDYQWMTLEAAIAAGYEFHHEPVVDGNGNIRVYYDEVLSRGRTDSTGMLSYGLTNNHGTLLSESGQVITHTHEDAQEYEDSIHYNKIYAVVETKAPEGYEVDPTPHFFVIPKDTKTMLNHGDLHTGSYFYHEEWPSSVHIVTQSVDSNPTYLLYMGNSSAPLSVTKTFGGSPNGLQPGSYSFGLWESGVTPTPGNMLQRVSITYREEDFGTYYTEASGTGENRVERYYFEENGQWIAQSYRNGVLISTEHIPAVEGKPNGTTEHYGILPGHQRTAYFQKLNSGNYQIFELNDAGYPITEGYGTVNGNAYTVTIGGDANADGSITYNATHNKVKVTNASYELGVTKSFHDAGTRSDAGIAGTYRFGIWKNADVDPDTGLPRPGVLPAADPVTMIWWADESDTQEKTEWFTNLEAGTQYRIFELDAKGQPVRNNTNAMIDHSMFRVTYPSNNGNLATTIGANQTGDGAIVKVCNNVAYTTLPRTGGMGTDSYTYGGLSLMALACLGYISSLLLRRRRKEGSPD